MATNLDLSTETQINDITANLEHNNDVTALADGTFVSVYERDFSGTDHDIFARRINADGTTSGTVITINNDGLNETGPAVAARLNTTGGFAVDYVVGGNELHVTTLNSANGLVGANLTAITGGNQSGADIVALADGREIVADQYLNGAEFDLAFRVVNPNGTTFATSAAFIGGATAANEFTPALAAVGNNAVVVYETSAGPSPDNIFLREFDGATNTFGAAVTVADHALGLFQPDVAALADGRYVVVYAGSAGSGSDVFGNIYDPATNTFGGEFVIDNTPATQFEPHVAGTPDGGFVVNWTDLSGNPDYFGDTDGSGAIMARRFDSTGTPIGDQFLVNQTGTSGLQINSHVAVSGSNVEMTWDDSGARPGDADGGVRGVHGTLTVDTIFGTTGDDTIAPPATDFAGHVAGTGAIGLINTYSVGEVINADDGNDLVHGGGGADAISGGNGNDVIFGDAGDDNLGGNAGDDVIHGGTGNDTIGGDDGNNTLFGDDGNDVMFGGSGNDFMSGGNGDDIMVGLDGADLMSGDDGNDNMNGGAGADILIGGLGNDTVGGGADNDVVVGNEGDDQLFGEDGADQMAGGDGNDTMVGGNGDDVMGGGIGNDVMVGGDGNDGMFGEDGDDNMNAGNGNDVLLGGNGNDTMGGGAGDDNIRGEAGNDVLFGEDGNDFITGGTGNDIMVGGNGNDQFVFTAGDGNDTITDFAAGGPDDLIILQATNLHTLGDVQAATTIVGGAAVITYNGTNTITLNGVTSVAQLTVNDFAFL